MPHSWHLGNDVVDLTDPRHGGKAGDNRFLQRVFSPEEQEDIRTSLNPDRALWMRWAGKEAAFKTVSKAQGSAPIFNHPSFRTTVFGRRGALPDGAPPPDNPMSRFGQVEYERFLLPLRIEVVGTTLHAVTWTPDPGHDIPPFVWGSQEAVGPTHDWRGLLEARFSAKEWDCVSHRASALARLAARRSLAASLKVEDTAIEIGCGPGEPGRRIPKVLLGGEEAPVDLTLSHHGRLLAWAYLIPPQLKGR